MPSLPADSVASETLSMSVGTVLSSSVSQVQTSSITSALPSILQDQNISLSALPTGLVDIVTHLYHMVRPRGIDMATQTEGVAKVDKPTQMVWILD